MFNNSNISSLVLALHKALDGRDEQSFNNVCARLASAPATKESVVLAIDNNGENALHKAFRLNNKKIIETLLADLRPAVMSQAMLTRDKNHNTPLIYVKDSALRERVTAHLGFDNAKFSAQDKQMLEDFCKSVIAPALPEKEQQRLRRLAFANKKTDEDAFLLALDTFNRVIKSIITKVPDDNQDESKQEQDSEPIEEKIAWELLKLLRFAIQYHNLSKKDHDQIRRNFIEKIKALIVNLQGFRIGDKYYAKSVQKISESKSDSIDFDFINRVIKEREDKIGNTTKKRQEKIADEATATAKAAMEVQAIAEQQRQQEELMQKRRQNAENFSYFFLDEMKRISATIKELVADTKLEEVESFERNYTAAASIDAFLVDEDRVFGTFKTVTNYLAFQFNQDIALIKSKLVPEKATELLREVVHKKANMVFYGQREDLGHAVYRACASGDLTMIVGLLSNLALIDQAELLFVKVGTQKSAIECCSNLKVGDILVGIDLQNFYYELIKKRMQVPNSIASIVQVEEVMQQKNMDLHLLQVYVQYLIAGSQYGSKCRLLEPFEEVLITVLTFESDADFTIKGQSFKGQDFSEWNMYRDFSIPQFVCTAAQRKEFKQFLLERKAEKTDEYPAAKKIMDKYTILKFYKRERPKRNELPLKERMAANCSQPIASIARAKSIADVLEKTKFYEKDPTHSPPLSERLHEFFDGLFLMAPDAVIIGTTIITKLLEQISVIVKRDGEQSFLHKACGSGDKEQIYSLLEHLDAAGVAQVLAERGGALNVDPPLCKIQDEKVINEIIDVIGPQKVFAINPALTKQAWFKEKMIVPATTTVSTSSVNSSATNMHRVNLNPDSEPTSPTVRSSSSMAVSGSTSASSSASTPATPLTNVAELKA